MTARPVLLAHLVYEVLAALDTGKYDDITTTEVTSHMRDGDLLQWLTDRLGQDADLSVFDAGGATVSTHLLDTVREDRDAINTAFKAFVREYGDGAVARWNIRHRGLYIIVAWATKMISG